MAGGGGGAGAGAGESSGVVARTQHSLSCAGESDGTRAAAAMRGGAYVITPDGETPTPSSWVPNTTKLASWRLCWRTRGSFLSCAESSAPQALMSLGRCLSTRAQGLRPAQRPRPALLLRGIATGASGAPPTGQTVALAFDHFPVPAARSRPPLHSSAAHGKPETASAQAVQRAGVQNVVVAHGLFGSKQNWRSLGRRMAQRWGVPVYTIDLRNHGESPHLDGMHYADMASDVVRFLGERQLQGSLLIGHSMGGKTALATALSPELSPGVLSGLVSVDMSPARGALSAEFAVRALLSQSEGPVY